MIKTVDELTEYERYQLDCNLSPLLQGLTVNYNYEGITFDMKLIHNERTKATDIIIQEVLQ